MCLCCQPSKSFRSACCCLPLALVVLLISCALIAWGGWEMYFGIDEGRVSGWNAARVFVCIVAAIRLLSGVGGLLAVLLRIPAGCGLLNIALKIMLVSMIVTFVLQWIDWGTKLNATGAYRDQEKWKPDSRHVGEITSFTIIYVIFFAAAWWAFSVIASLQAVLKEGGSGWGLSKASEVSDKP